MAMPRCFLSEGNTCDFTLIYQGTSVCLVRRITLSYRQVGTQIETYLRCAAEITLTEKELMMPEPDSSIQVLSNLSQLPINSTEGH